MTDLPPIICDYLCRRSVAHRRPVYLHLDRTGNIRDGGGDLAAYDLAPLAVGQPVSTVLEFMEGLLPLEDDVCHLGCLQPQDDICIDAHIIPDMQAYWLLLLDTREEERQRRAMQQKANELALVREAQARLLTRRPSVSGPELPTVNFDPRGDRRQIAVLAVNFRLAADTDSETPPSVLLDRLTLRQRRLTAGLHAEAGLVHAQTSDTLVVLFGLLPAQAGPSEQALTTALNLQHTFSADTGGREATAGSALPPAVVVTTGTALVGLEAAPSGARLHAVGPPLQAASQLLPAAEPGRVITDANSFLAAGRLQARFEPYSTERAVHADPVYADRGISHP